MESPFPRRYRSVAVAFATAALVTTTACGPDNPTPLPCTTNCELGALGTARGVTVGAAVTSNSLTDPAYATAVTTHFNSVTPEFEMKWRHVHPTATTWNWSGADAIVAFAALHGLKVKGHTLLWAKDNANPAWLLGLTDPAAFRAAVVDGIRTEVGRYAGRVDRWDVVNEPLTRSGSTIDQNSFYNRIGADYIDLAFRTARSADPTAELWLNETGLEFGTTRVDGFVGLVESLLARGVPIDGVGLQSHLLSVNPVAAGHYAALVTRLRALGVKVAITEMDVPTGTPRTLAAQADLYRQVTSESLRSGCTEVTTWGVSDRSSWLDDPATRADLPSLIAFDTPSRPLLLDASFQPKSAYAAVADSLLELPLRR